MTPAEGRLFAQPSASQRHWWDEAARRAFSAITVLPVLLILVVGIALVVRAWPITRADSILDMLLGRVWKPEEGLFGFWPFITGTAWVTVVGVLLSVPPCLLVALYLSEYAHSRTRSVAKPVLDLLAAIPPVVYGLWGLLAIVPFIQGFLAPLANRWLSSISIFRVNQPTGFTILAGGFMAAKSNPFLMALMVIAVLETVGGGLLLVGLFTRPVAFILSGEMAVAYFQFHAPRGFSRRSRRGRRDVGHHGRHLGDLALPGSSWSAFRAGREPDPLRPGRPASVDRRAQGECTGGASWLKALMTWPAGH